MWGVAVNGGGGAIPGKWDLNFPSFLGWTRRLGGCCPAGECPRRAALAPPSCSHLHFASFQSVEVLRSTFAAMARGAQARTPALRPTAAAPQAPTPAEVRAHGWCALRDARGPHAVLRVLVAPGEGPGQGRGAPSSCPAARSCARRRDARLCRNMSRRRGAAPRPLRLSLPCSGSLSLIYLGTRWRVPARGDLLGSQRAARPEKPRRAAGHPGTCSPGRRQAPALVNTRARPAQPAESHSAGARLSDGRAPAVRPPSGLEVGNFQLPGGRRPWPPTLSPSPPLQTSAQRRA